jgi:hypothetical protein
MVSNAASLNVPRLGSRHSGQPTDEPSVWERTTVAFMMRAVRSASSIRKYVGYATPPTFSSRPSQ